MFSCHGEYQTGLCLGVRGKHKSHSPAIKAARLETWECAECIFSISSSPLFSAHSSCSGFFVPATCLKGEMDSSYCCLNISLFSHCPRVLLYMHYCYAHVCSSLLCVSLLRLNWNLVLFFFRRLSFHFFVVLVPLPLPASFLSSSTQGCTALLLMQAPSHCKRMSLSHCKQSAFIMSYLPGPPWQQSWYPGRENVFGPVASRVKVYGSGK